MERLLDLDVRWLLPGNGRWHAFAAGERLRELERLLERGQPMGLGETEHGFAGVAWGCLLAHA